MFAMAKALTASIGLTDTAGGHNWVQDLKNAVWSRIRFDTPPPVPQTDPPAAVTGGLRGEVTGTFPLNTPWAMMSLAFANASNESTEKFLPDDPALTYPIRGTVVLETTGGVTISTASRVSAPLPIGGFSFTLNNVPCGGNYCCDTCHARQRL